MSANGHRARNPNARFEAPTACPCPPTDIPLGAPPEPSARSRAVDRTDSAEKAALARARSEAQTTLLLRQRRLGPDVARLVGSGEGTVGAIEDVERLSGSGAIPDAFREVAAIEADRANDGPEDLRRAPRVWRVLHVVTAVAAGVFEASFVASVVRQVIDVDDQRRPDYWFAYLPGVGAAVCLIALGRLIAVQGFRRKVHARHAAGTPEGADAAPPHDVPKPSWWGPILATLVLGGMVGSWAWLRFAEGNGEDSGSTISPAFAPTSVVLMLVLAAAAVVATALAHNPYADRYREARSRRDAVRTQARRELAAARRKLTKHSDVWTTVDAAAKLAEDKARRIIDDTRADLMDDRARTGVAGSPELPEDDLSWLFAPSCGCHRGENGSGSGHWTRSTTLEDVRRALERYRPETLTQRLDKAAETLNAQWRKAASAPDGAVSPPEDDPVPEDSPAAEGTASAPEDNPAPAPPPKEQP